MIRFSSLLPPPLVLLLLAGCASPPPPKPAAAEVSTSSAPVAPKTTYSFEWPVMEGWKKETIPFPLDFAPSLPYQGKEELRFGPRFFKPDSETYFTYTFAFVLDHAPAFSTNQFASDVKTYFNGLASAVTKSPSEPSLHEASFTATSQDQDHFEGTAKTIDAFSKDHHPISLHVIGETRLCGDHRIILASLSPKSPKSDPAIWETLAKVRSSFVCQPQPQPQP